MYPVHCCEYFLPGFSSFLSSQTDGILPRYVFRFFKKRICSALQLQIFNLISSAMKNILLLQWLYLVCLFFFLATKRHHLIAFMRGQNKKKWKVMHFQKRRQTLSNCVYWARTPWWYFLLTTRGDDSDLTAPLLWVWLTGLKCAVMMFAICQGLLGNHTQYDTNWALCVIKLQDTASHCG